MARRKRSYSKRKKGLEWLWIEPDGVRIWVEISTLEPGCSVFIPCLNTKEAYEQFMIRYPYPDHRFFASSGISGQRYGLRIWRTNVAKRKRRK